jgi:hypothetical protein
MTKCDKCGIEILNNESPFIDHSNDKHYHITCSPIAWTVKKQAD